MYFYSNLLRYFSQFYKLFWHSTKLKKMRFWKLNFFESSWNSKNRKFAIYEFSAIKSRNFRKMDVENGKMLQIPDYAQTTSTQSLLPQAENLKFNFARFYAILLRFGIFIISLLLLFLTIWVLHGLFMYFSE